MNAMTLDLSAASIAGRLERREQDRSGLPLPLARKAVAIRTGIAAGTLENLQRGRSKGVRQWVADRLRAAIIAELEADIDRAEHELLFLRASARRVDQEQIAEVEQSLATLRVVLRGQE